MECTINSTCGLSDAALVAQVTRLAGQERQATAALIASLAEFDTRRLYLQAGCSSLFTYCTSVLHLSEHAAYGRIEAARATRRFPVILNQLEDGSITLTAVCLLGPVLTADNCDSLLDAVRHKSKRDVEQLVAALRPKPAVPTALRKLPSPRAAEVPQFRLDTAQALTREGAIVSEHKLPKAPSDEPAHPERTKPSSTQIRPGEVRALAPERYKLQITMSRETHDRLRRAQELMRHRVPNGDPAAIVERALALLVEHLERTKHAATKRPRRSRARSTASRHIPAAVRRAVWMRDGGRCAFVGTHGRCTERGFLEFHHVVPHARGGPAEEVNVELRCRQHNAYEAEREFGPRAGSLVRERFGTGERFEGLIDSIDRSIRCPDWKL